MNPSSRHPALLLLATARRTPATVSQLHAHFLTTGLAHHSYPLSRLLLFSSLPPLSPVLSISILLHSPRPPSTFLCNTLISSFSSSGYLLPALHLYSLLRLPNPHSFPSLLAHSPTPISLVIHARILKLGPEVSLDCFVAASLINLYSWLGKLDVCHYLFDEMPKRDRGAWNSVILACARCGEGEEALGLFREMLGSGVGVDETTVVAVVGVCGDLGALGEGVWVHGFVKRRRLEVNRFVGTALVDMYGKCGRLDLAEQVFRALRCRDAMCYNTMIRGLGIHGQGRDALCLFEKMKKEGVEVDDVTFVVVMCACAHAGLVEEGRRCFDSMEADFGIEPKVEHYGCLVDLLGRAGQLEDADKVLGVMPMKPNAALYRTLLRAYRINKNFEVGEHMIKKLIEMEPEHGGNYVLLSNIYANMDRWDDVRRVRKMMKDRGIDKNPGSSLVEINGAVHEFVIGDRTHPNSEEIYNMLDEIGRRLHEFGHRPSTREVLFDVEEEEKEDALSYHSERLAISFALVASDSMSPIRIIKNLRVCWDCHTSTKLISLIYRREIIMRDRLRFHHFKDGICSCLDYW